MLEAIKDFWKSLEPKVNRTIAERTRNCVRRERYDVTTPPNGQKIGVTPPYGTEIFLPYAPTVAQAQIGQAVVVEWRGSLSTGVAVSFGDGIVGFADFPITIGTSWEGSGPYTQTISAPGMRVGLIPIPSLIVPSSGQSAAITAFKSIVAVQANNNSVTIYADTPTSASIDVSLKI